VQCRETRRGRTIYIRGEAGIGKTRLLEQLQERPKRRTSPVTADWCSTSEWAPPGRNPLARPQPARFGGESSRKRSRQLLEKTIADGMLADERRVYLNDLPERAAAD
jgi:predicted ATPase